MGADLDGAVGRKAAGQHNPGMEFLLFKLQHGRFPLITCAKKLLQFSWQEFSFLRVRLLSAGHYLDRSHQPISHTTVNSVTVIDLIRFKKIPSTGLPQVTEAVNLVSFRLLKVL
jgi:hypothetical protein